jgi:exopolysaccharide production protein ExoQ
MPPTIAAAVFALLIVGLNVLDRDKESRVSPALWIAVAWIFIGASRMVSQWLGGGIGDSAEAYLEGSPLDRNILTALIIAGLIVLVARGRRTGAFLGANAPIMVFVLYCAISCLWSDFPLVASKRLTKALGNLVMVLVVLTDPDPRFAVRRVLARCGFLLIPLSVLLIKYYPEIGRDYIKWEWTSVYLGVATDKNGLGAICLVFGVASLWRVIQVFCEKDSPRKARQLAAHGILLAMTLWLFGMADSSTSMACFLLAGLLIFVTIRNKDKIRTPARLHAVMATIAGVALMGYLFQDAYAFVVESLGRNTTLTGRTDIWADLFRMDFNPWFGTGFESFWLGPRLDYLWHKYYFHPNQAHNGYIETYLNLGWIGVGLLVFLLVSGYRNVVSAYRQDPTAGSLRLAFLVVAAVYNVTEAAFKVMHPVWIAFFLAVTAVPQLLADESTVSTEVVPVAPLRLAKGSVAPPLGTMEPWKRPQSSGPLSGGHGGRPLNKYAPRQDQTGVTRR